MKRPSFQFYPSDWHGSRWGSFDSVVIKARFGDKLGDWAAMEIRLISRLQPPFNCVGGQKRRAAL